MKTAAPSSSRRGDPSAVWRLRLYVAGTTQRSVQALMNIHKIGGYMVDLRKLEVEAINGAK